jgi:poly [ADP-ribose] polymerase 10/14/15
LVGEFAQGKDGLKEPPLKPGSTVMRYDSTVDDVNKPEIFVVFHDADAYPEYLIRFYPKNKPGAND